jgi:hypothetical protein
MPAELNVPEETAKNTGESGLGTRLELLRMKIQKIEDPDDKALPKLLDERRRLQKALDIRRAKKRLKRLLEDEGEDDDDDIYF